MAYNLSFEDKTFYKIDSTAGLRQFMQKIALLYERRRHLSQMTLQMKQMG